MKAPTPTAKNAAPEKSDVTERPWELIETAPKNGTVIEAKYDPDEEAVVTIVWRQTTRRNPDLRRWVPVGFWSVPWNREPLTREPFCWRMPEGFLNPGMMVA